MTLCKALGDLAGDAQRLLGYCHTQGFGPIPLTLKAGSPGLLRTFSGSLLASTRAVWPALEVTLLSGGELPWDQLPETIRPRSQDVLVARGEGCTLLSSGPEQTLWLFQPEQAAAVMWAHDLDALPPWEHSSPLRAAARWWAAHQGGAMVHAGAVGDGERCVLLVGAGGAGKSTSTLACLDRGLQVLGDDYCLLQPPGAANAVPSVHGMYRVAKLDERSLGLLPALRERVIGPAWRGKWLVDLEITEADALSLAAMCEVVQDPSGPTRVEPLSRMQTLRALAPSTLFQQRLWERETWQALTATIRCVPCFRLLVNDPQDVPDQVHGLLARRAP